MADPPDTAKLAIVVPLLDEAPQIDNLADHLRTFDCPQILVDGGSRDGTWERLRELAGADPRVTACQCPAGRAMQMNHGARRATADWLLFLHADCRLPPGAIDLLMTSVADGRVWGRFDVRFDESGGAFRLIAFFMNWRSALSGICTGDQAIFVRREIFVGAGGYAEIPLMEDIELSRRLKRISRPLRLRQPVTTSGRRWRRQGIARTVVAMWRYRLMYWLGRDPAVLARHYRHVR